MPTRRSPSPVPQGAVLPHPQALIPAGVSHSKDLRTSFPAPPEGGLHPLGSRSPPPPRNVLPRRNLRPPQHKPSAQSPFLSSPAPASVPSSPSRAAEDPSPTTNRPRSPVAGLRTRGTAPLTFSRRWWRRRTSPAATTEPALQSQTHRCLRRAPLALLLQGCPTHSHPHWPAPRPSPPPPDPLVRLRAHLQGEDVSNPNEATFPRSVPSTT